MAKKTLKTEIAKIPLGLRLSCILIFLLAFILAFAALQSQVIFGFDQARDAFEAHAIWANHDLKILGPSSDLPGVHHGVFWYYILAIAYAFGSGDPGFAALFFFILSFLTLPLCGYVVYKLFHSVYLSALSMLFYVFAPLFGAFTRWLSNPLLAIYITPVLLLFLWQYIQKQNKRSAFILGICMGLLIQADFAFGIFLVTIPCYWIIYKLRFRLMTIGLFFAGLLLAVSSFLVADIKFRGKTTLAMLHFLGENKSSHIISIELPLLILKRIGDLLSITLLPFPRTIILPLFFLGLLFLAIRIAKNNERKELVFLLIWFGTILVFYFFKSGIVQSDFLFGPFLFTTTVLGSYILFHLIKKHIIFAFLIPLTLGAQILLSLSWIQREFNPLSVQIGINLTSEKALIDYTYRQSEKNPFITVSITNPLYINTTWAYLYEFYGKKVYGYVPYWAGPSQKGYLGNLPDKVFDTKDRYLIIEPTEGIPQFFIDKIIHEEDGLSDIIETKSFGKFNLQRRQFHPYKQLL